MKSRLIVAAIGVPLCVVVLAVLPSWGTAVFCALISAVGAHELLNAAGLGNNVPVSVAAIACALWVNACAYFDLGSAALAAGGAVYLVITAALGVARYERGKSFGMAQTGAAILAGAAIPLCFSALIHLRLGPCGVYAVLWPFVIAFIGDGGALFIGMACGKHKLAVRTSPKKTVEGALGGLACSVLFTLLYGIVLRFAFKLSIDFAILAIWSAIGGVVSQLGDLLFSLLKRESGLKDYGTILPGHGGVLDRFDSMATLAPVMALLVCLSDPFI